MDSLKRKEPDPVSNFDDGECGKDDVKATKLSKSSVVEDFVSSVTASNNRESEVVSDVETTKASGNKTPDDDIALVYEILDISEKSQARLAQLGITGMVDLLKHQSDLEEAKLVGVKARTQKQLSTVCLLYDEFREKHSGGVAWEEHFSEDSLEAFEKGRNQLVAARMVPPSIQILYGHAMALLHEEGQGSLGRLPAEKFEQLYAHAAHLAVSDLNESLRLRCNFPLQEYATRWVKAIINLPSGGPYESAMVVSGKTQAGKSAVKAVLNNICRQLEVPMIIITKGVGESLDLKNKINSMMNNDERKDACPFKSWWKKKASGECYVIADTAAQIRRAIRLIQDMRSLKPSGKFVVIVDECDAMYRTQERGQQMERAYDQLMALKPALRVEISATLVPALLTLMLDHNLPVEMMKINSSENYSGFEKMHPYEVGGSQVHLNPKALKHSAGVDYKWTNLKLTTRDNNYLFPYCYKEHPDCKECQKVRCHSVPECNKHNDREKVGFSWPSGRGLDFIPYSCKSMMHMYRQALSDPCKKGVLLLDCTAVRVYAELNIFDKAVCIQNYFAAQDQAVFIVINVGSGIFFRRPGFKTGRYVSNKRKVSDVIERIDEEYGLEMPVFVFGYSKMRRCVSYRSSMRVPTHLTLFLGSGHSNESVIQAIGRATFNGKDILKENGHDRVTVLMSNDDLVMARKYENFIDEVYQRIEKGQDPQDALMGAKGNFPDETNFLRHTNRKVGQRKDFRSKLPGPDKFIEPVDFDEERHKKELFRDDTTAQRVMKAFDNLAEEDRKYVVTEDDIIVKFNDTFQDNDPGNHFRLTKGALRKCLTMLKDQAVIERVGDKTWKAKSLAILDYLITDDDNSHDDGNDGESDD